MPEVKAKYRNRPQLEKDLRFNRGRFNLLSNTQVHPSHRVSAVNTGTYSMISLGGYEGTRRSNVKGNKYVYMYIFTYNNTKICPLLIFANDDECTGVWGAWNIFSLLPLFKKNKRRLMISPCCLCVYTSVFVCASVSVRLSVYPL
jgi:hypothetical protein